MHDIINLEQPLKDKLSNLLLQFFTDSLEVIFCNLLVVQLKMRDRLGNEKTDNVTFMFKILKEIILYLDFSCIRLKMYLILEPFGF